jgi:uncharacterized protein with NRDE domain
MCLIALDWKPDENPALIVASNRDEFYERPSLPAKYWEDEPHVYGGRDVVLGGSWICCSTSGRCAAVTNFHSKEDRGKKYPRSRGEIISNFVRATLSSEEFSLSELDPYKSEYGGFSAILFDGKSLVCCSNRDKDQFSRSLSPGTYGLSNHLLNTPWPKVEKLKTAVVQSRRLGKDPRQLALELLKELEATECVQDKSVLPTTLSPEEEHVCSAIFVKSPHFGTRTSTVVTFVPGKGFHYTEKNHETAYSTSSSFSHEFVPESSTQHPEE